MIAAPFVAGADHDTDNCCAPFVSVGADGASGAFAGVAVAEVDHKLSPERLVAATCT